MKKATYIHGTSPDEQARLAKLNELTNKSFIEFLNPAPSSRVLEVGSGLGMLAEEVSLRVPQGQVTGLEFSENQLALAEVRKRPNLNFVQGDAHELPFRDHSFDVVYCRYVLEHVSDPPRVVREMHRALKPGGKIFVQENNNLALELYPECLEFDLLWQNFQLLQEALGGDGLVGKKLLPLLKQGGFSTIELSLAPEVHWAGTPTFEAWTQNLISNIRASENDLKVHSLANEKEIAAGISELDALIKNDEAASFFYWNRAVGTK